MHGVPGTQLPSLAKVVQEAEQLQVNLSYESHPGVVPWTVVLGDGNCLWRAIHKSVARSLDEPLVRNWKVLKKRSLQQLRAHGVESEWLVQATKYGAWGDTRSLLGAALYLRAQFVICDGDTCTTTIVKLTGGGACTQHHFVYAGHRLSPGDLCTGPTMAIAKHLVLSAGAGGDDEGEGCDPSPEDHTIDLAMGEVQEDEWSYITVRAALVSWSRAFRMRNDMWRFRIRNGAALADVAEWPRKAKHVRRDQLHFYKDGTEIPQETLLVQGEVLEYRLVQGEVVASTRSRSRTPPSRPIRTVSPTEPFESASPAGMERNMTHGGAASSSSSTRPAHAVALKQQREAPLVSATPVAKVEEPEHDEGAGVEQPVSPAPTFPADDIYPAPAEICRLTLRVPTIFRSPPAAQRDTITIATAISVQVQLQLEEGCWGADLETMFNGRVMACEAGNLNAIARGPITSEHVLVIDPPATFQLSAGAEPICSSHSVLAYPPLHGCLVALHAGAGESAKPGTPTMAPDHAKQYNAALQICRKRGNLGYTSEQLKALLRYDPRIVRRVQTNVDAAKNALAQAAVKLGMAPCDKTTTASSSKGASGPKRSDASRSGTANASTPLGVKGGGAAARASSPKKTFYGQIGGVPQLVTENHSTAHDSKAKDVKIKPKPTYSLAGTWSHDIRGDAANFDAGKAGYLLG